MRVLILDANPTVRAALGDLFESEPHVHVTVAADVASAGRGSYDAVLADELLAGAFTSHTRLALEALARRAPVVVMGMGDRLSYEDAHVAAGAVGYWPKDGDIDAVLALVRAAGLVARADRACTVARQSPSARFAPRRAQLRTSPAA
jgi:DNA-binding NarL/FixJ family response regulator